MDYLILGNPKGTPVVYLPLDYGLVRWTAAAEADAAKRNLKVIVPVRAGYAHSTPLPKRTPYTEQVCDDLAVLMDHLGVAKAPFLTIGADTHFAVQFNAAHPHRMTALVACAGILPLTPLRINLTAWTSGTVLSWRVRDIPPICCHLW